MENQYNKETSGAYSNRDRLENPERKYLYYPNFLKECGDLAGKDALDLGCGPGNTTLMLLETGARSVTGIDHAPEQIKIAKKNIIANNIEFIRADANKLPISDALFDLITPTLLLHYASTKEELKKFLKETFRCLKPGGRMVAINQRPENPVKEYKFGNSSYAQWLDAPYQNGSRVEITLYQGEKPTCTVTNYYWSRETYNELLKEIGFTGVRWERLRFSEEGKTILPNWQDLEENAILCLLIAEKPF